MPPQPCFIPPPLSLNTVPPHFSSFLSSETFSIVAESGQRRFVIHSNILAAQPKPLRSTAKETAEKTIDLSDWDGGTVERFLQFLYIGNYQFPELLPEDEDDENDELDTSERTGANTPDTVQSLADRAKSEAAEVNLLLVHAKLYVLAQLRDVEALEAMAFDRLRTTLQTIDGKMSPRVKVNVIQLLEYALSLSSPRTGEPEEPMRELVLAFSAKNFKSLIGQMEMRLLLREGGDHALEVMEKVAERFCDAEEFYTMGEKLSGMEREAQESKNQAAASAEKVRVLEAVNKEMQQLGVTNAEKMQKLVAKVRQLEITSAEKVKQLETKMRQSRAINMESIRELEATNAAKVREIESASAARVKELENKVKMLESKVRSMEYTRHYLGY